jgi:Uma2 family endonuclease
VTRPSSEPPETNTATVNVREGGQDEYDLSWLPPGQNAVDVLDMLPGDRRYELVDGQLTIMNVPTNRHQLVSFNLVVALRALLRGEWTTLFAPGFSRNPFNYRVPDLAVCTVEAANRNTKGAYLRPDETCLLVEVVSESTMLTDRVTKPAEYASTGVPYYLRVELDDSGRVVKLYLHENIENPHREFESDPERVFHRIGETMTGGAPLPLPKPFTGALDPSGL